MFKYLDSIQQPEDMKKLDEGQLMVLAEEIRHFLVQSVSKTGGHLASNLGIVELTIALHQVFDTNRDRLVWDVGHQSYVHKILTGRSCQFHSLRQYEGLSGFPKRKESCHDHFDTGHSSTSISAALGMAAVRDLKQEDYSIIAVIGDGALTGGMAFEALNHAGQNKTNLLVILNDNEMSISENVGGMSDYLSKIRTMPVYFKVKSDIEALVGRIPMIGKRAVKVIERAKDSVKYFILPGVLFEELGFTYIGPVDGHNLSSLTKTLKQCQNLKGPVLVHVLTKKGKGYGLAERSPEQFHGVGPFDVETGAPLKTGETPSYSEVAGNTLIKFAESDPRVVAITAAMPAGTGLTQFARRFPDRFFDVGIAEQHAVTFAAGIAASGYRPFIPIYSTFLQRGFDQVLHDVCLQNLPVTLLIDRAGLVGNDGETHHGTFDISFLACIPNITLMAPKDGPELEAMIGYALQAAGPVAIRYPRGNVSSLAPEERLPLSRGKGEILMDNGRDAVIFALGTMAAVGLEAAALLQEKGIGCTVVNPRFIKPLDQELVLAQARRCRQVYTLEDHTQVGGFGSLVLACLNEARLTIPLRQFALPDQFVAQGDMTSLYGFHGLTAPQLAEAIEKDFAVMRSVL